MDLSISVGRRWFGGVSYDECVPAARVNRTERLMLPVHAAAALSLLAVTHACPDGWHSSAYGCHKVPDVGGLYQQECTAQCTAAAGGQTAALASIHSAEENDYLLANVVQPAGETMGEGAHGGGYRVWIGLYRYPTTSREYLWTDGTTVDYTAWAATTNEPRGIWTCAMITGEARKDTDELGKWISWPCAYEWPPDEKWRTEGRRRLFRSLSNRRRLGWTDWKCLCATGSGDSEHYRANWETVQQVVPNMGGECSVPAFWTALAIVMLAPTWWLLCRRVGCCGCAKRKLGDQSRYQAAPAETVSAAGVVVESPQDNVTSVETTLKKALEASARVRLRVSGVAFQLGYALLLLSMTPPIMTSAGDFARGCSGMQGDLTWMIMFVPISLYCLLLSMCRGSTSTDAPKLTRMPSNSAPAG